MLVDGHVLYVSGTLGTLPGTDPLQLVSGGAGAEMRQALMNIGAVLDAVGASFDNGWCGWA